MLIRISGPSQIVKDRHVYCYTLTGIHTKNIQRQGLRCDNNIPSKVIFSLVRDVRNSPKHVINELSVSLSVPNVIYFCCWDVQNYEIVLYQTVFKQYVCFEYSLKEELFRERRQFKNPLKSISYLKTNF